MRTPGRAWAIAVASLVSISIHGCGDETSAAVEEDSCVPSSLREKLLSRMFYDRADKACLCNAALSRFEKAAPATSQTTVDWTKFDNVLFRYWPMIFSHDAGTGYAEHPTCSTAYQINNFAVTQQGGFLEQLNCGARAFDLRARVDPDGNLGFTHGRIKFFGTTVKKALTDVVEWARSNPDELVIFVPRCPGSHAGVSVAKAQECRQKLQLRWDEFGIKSASCGFFETSTLGALKTYGRLPGGGSALVMGQECPYENYDTSIVCHAPAKHCYDDRAADVRDRLWEYVTKTASDETQALKTRKVQVHWQYTLEAISTAVQDPGLKGEACILNDEETVCVNLGMAARVREGGWLEHSLNFIDIDNVCHHGPELFTAVREYVNSPEFAKFVPSG